MYIENVDLKQNPFESHRIGRTRLVLLRDFPSNLVVSAVYGATKRRHNKNLNFWIGSIAIQAL